MDRKNILVLLLALVVLVGGIFFVIRRANNRNMPTPTPSLSGKETHNAKTAVDVTGNIEVIGEKTVTVKNANEVTVANINGATPVMISDGKNPAVAGQMADLKLGDAVKMTYDKTTKNVMVVLVMRSAPMQKTK